MRVVVDGVPLDLEPHVFPDGVEGFTFSGSLAGAPGSPRVRVMLSIRPLDVQGPDVTPPSGRSVEDALLERLSTAKVVRAHLNKGGTSLSLRVDLDGGLRGSFRPAQINPNADPRKEVAAYRVSRALDLELVPPSTLRAMRRDELVGKLPPSLSFFRHRIDAEAVFDEHEASLGSITEWIPGLNDARLDNMAGLQRWWEALRCDAPPATDPVHQQLSSLLLLDCVINNWDRFSGENLMMSADGRHLFGIDNALGFEVTDVAHARCRQMLSRCERFSAKAVESLRGLSAGVLGEELCGGPVPLLEPEALRALLARASAALSHVDALVRKHGRERVLVFP